MPHTAGQEAEILAKPGPHALLSTAFEQASGGHTPENRAWIPGNADGLSPMLQTSAAHTADGLASALQTALTHRITKGETLYEIAQAYQLPLLQLILWNRITDPTKIQPGKAVRLTRPSRDYQKKPLTETPTIAAAATTGTAPFELELSYLGSIPEGSFLWDLGDWRFAFNKTPTHVYSEPGLYTVKLRSFDNSGQEHSSNSLTVGLC